MTGITWRTLLLLSGVKAKAETFIHGNVVHVREIQAREDKGILACQSVVVEEFACPLTTTRGPCVPIKQRIYIYNHSFIKIGDKCYDYGSWNYARVLDCDSQLLKCCIQNARLVSRISSKCVDKMPEFNIFWTAKTRSYETFTHNCRHYTHSVMVFLRRCDNLTLLNGLAQLQSF